MTSTTVKTTIFDRKMIQSSYLSQYLRYTIEKHHNVLQVLGVFINLPSAGPANILGPNFATTVPADVLPRNGAKPSVGTGMTTKSHLLSMKLRRLPVILFWPNDVIQNGRRDLT